MYKVKLSDMTTNYKQLQAELAITEHKVESMSKEIQKLESDLEETRQELVCDDSNETEGEIFRRMNTGANSKEMMRRVSLKMFNATCSIISVISYFLCRKPPNCTSQTNFITYGPIMSACTFLLTALY